MKEIDIIPHIVRTEDLKILVVCEENVGRSQMAEAHFRSALERDNIPIKSISSAGIRPPTSGRTDVHKSVVETTKKRFHQDISANVVKQIYPEMVDENTLVIILFFSHKMIPDYVYKTAFDVLIAGLEDPYPDLGNKLDHLATKLSYFSWLLFYILTRKFDELGKRKNTEGVVEPRWMIEYEPLVEQEYSYLNWG